MIDNTATVVALARTNLQSLDRSSLNTTLPTATLELLLKTLIHLGSPRGAQPVHDSAVKTVMGVVASLSDATKVENDRSEARSTAQLAAFMQSQAKR